MSETVEFDPRNFREQRRVRLARIAAAAVEAPWPTSEKAAPAQAVQPVPAPKPVLTPARAYQPWFTIEGEIAPEAPAVRFRPTVHEITNAVARRYNIARIDLRSARRMAVLVLPRHIAFYLCRRLTMKSLPELGRQFGGRDHTTILHGIRKVERLVLTDPAIAGDVAMLIEVLGGEDTET